MPDEQVHAMTSRTPIVVFGDDWGRHVSTMQHLFRHVALQFPVVWVNSIGHRVPRLNLGDLGRAVEKGKAVLRRSAKSAAPSPVFQSGGTPRRIVHPRVLPWHHIGPVHAANNWSLLRAVRATLSEMGGHPAPLLVTGTPPSASIVGQLGEIASIYLCMDDFLHLPNVSPEMLGPLEQRLLERVDATVATAKALVESKRPRSGRSYYLPQGVNYEHFASPQPSPADLAGLPRPLIGFAGGITTPVDFPLMRRIAKEFPKASIVMVGPVLVDRSELEAPNIHLLGARPYAQLPAYVQAFDVGIIPYVLNDHTIAVDPLKLLEYLAAGIPVVTLDLPEVRKYAHAVAIATGHDAFISAVREAVDAPSGTTASRRSVAQSHDWSQRAAELVRIMHEVVASKV